MKTPFVSASYHINRSFQAPSTSPLMPPVDAYKSCKQKIDDKSLVVRSRSRAAAYKTGIDRKKQEQRKEKLAVGSWQLAVGRKRKRKRKKKKEKA
ncbi:hypothetical protein [Endozoicomonas acroporae]|uniref:hypothetical protein n=1 Tax=Endozoicomonas acroporae TaxID=1701104 RepID=UPI003D79DB23